MAGRAFFMVFPFRPDKMKDLDTPARGVPDFQ